MHKDAAISVLRALLAMEWVPWAEELGAWKKASVGAGWTCALIIFCLFSTGAAKGGAGIGAGCQESKAKWTGWREPGGTDEAPERGPREEGGLGADNGNGEFHGAF